MKFRQLAAFLLSSLVLLSGCVTNNSQEETYESTRVEGVTKKQVDDSSSLKSREEPKAKQGTTEKAKMAKVQQLLDEEYNEEGYGIYVESLVDESSASMNGNRLFFAASTGKLPALYYTQKMFDEKKIDPNKKFPYVDDINEVEDYSYMRDGAGVLQDEELGTEFSLDQIMEWTAEHSDNQGANFLGYYGGDKFGSDMQKEIAGIIGRPWHTPFEVTPKENALLMKAIYEQDGKLVTYLSKTDYDNERIAEYIPKDVKVAHKIGDAEEFTHDIAVVYAKNPYIISVMTEDAGSYEDISILSKKVYDILN